MPATLGLQSLIDGVTKLYSAGFRKRTENMLDGMFKSTLTPFAAGAFATAEAAPLATGQLIEFAGIAAPDGWLECDGSAVSRTTYAKLYAVVGTIYGDAPSDTTFRLPDLRGASVTGAGGTRIAGPETSVGASHDADSVTLTEAQLPQHRHSADRTSSVAGAHTHEWRKYPRHTFTAAAEGQSIGAGWGVPGVSYGQLSADADTGFSGTHDHTASGTVSDAGGGGAMSVQQPSLSVMTLIKT